MATSSRKEAKPREQRPAAPQLVEDRALAGSVVHQARPRGRRAAALASGSIDSKCDVARDASLEENAGCVAECCFTRDLAQRDEVRSARRRAVPSRQKQ